MLATGGLLVSIALLTLAAVAPVFRRDNPPRWTTRGWIGELVTLAIVCTLAIGIGYLGAGVIGAVQTGVDYVDLGLLAVVLFALVVVWRKLNARARPRALEANAGVYDRVPASVQAPDRGPSATAESLPATASAPPPPHRAA